MSNFKEDQFINLGKQLGIKEAQDEQYQTNFDILKKKFDNWNQLSISKKEFQDNSIALLESNNRDTNYMTDKDMYNSMYVKILEAKLNDTNEEIERMKIEHEAENELGDSYIKEIEILEARIKKGKEIVLSKNYIISDLNNDIKAKNQEINTWFLICCGILVNLFFCCTMNTTYLGIWYYSCMFIVNIVVYHWLDVAFIILVNIILNYMSCGYYFGLVSIFFNFLMD